MQIGMHDSLIIIDVQNDFLPGGSLAVHDSQRIIPFINRLTRLPFQTVVATQDWHPDDHCSFPEQGGHWPVHCVKGTIGAELSPLLNLDNINVIIKKGVKREVDSYSAFFDNDGMNPTGLKGILTEQNINRVFICGLAYDVCVFYTAKHAVRLGYDPYVIINASASAKTPINKVNDNLLSEGIKIISTESFRDI
ncbi:isochorismatase family protein [Gluconobacter wancherniae]|uniref:isochorismatase family protein n=1 Tax=Gluconobacter wancherniae TaxID=1307955 RepID=UPI001B8D0447|nr:isochorismatase family protein [Gluconobacter wancherniae]MBS1089838.1 isochorismatase family protein [Gluconobacter wancherniae]